MRRTCGAWIISLAMVHKPCISLLAPKDLVKDRSTCFFRPDRVTRFFSALEPILMTVHDGKMPILVLFN